MTLMGAFLNLLEAHLIYKRICTLNSLSHPWLIYRKIVSTEHKQVCLRKDQKVSEGIFGVFQKNHQ